VCKAISQQLAVHHHVRRWAAQPGARASAGGRGLCDLKMLFSDEIISGFTVAGNIFISLFPHDFFLIF